jgi:hypothetical protein
MAKGVFALLLVILYSGMGLAQSEDEQALARQHFSAGVAATEAGENERAAQFFQQSYDLFAHPGTLANLAAAYDQSNQRGAAYRAWNELVNRFGSVISAATRRQAQRRMAVLDSQLAAVVVTTDPPGAEVSVDGQRVGTTPFDGPLHLDPGQRVFSATLAGHRDQRAEQRLNAGPINDAVALVLVPTAAGAAVPEPTPSSESVPVEDSSQATLVVRSTTRRARMRIDNGEVQSIPFRQQLPAGSYELTVEARGHIAQTQTVQVPETGEVAIDVTLEEEARRPMPAVAKWLPTMAGLAIGVAGAAVAIAGATNYSRVSDAKENGGDGMSQAEAQDMLNRGETEILAGSILAGVGGAILATGVILFAVDAGRQDDDDDEDEPEAAGVGVSLVPSPAGGLLTIHGRF